MSSDGADSVFVYYETIDGDAGLAVLNEDGLHEREGAEYGTEYEMEWESFFEFVQGADGEMYSFDDLSVDEDGLYYPDGYIRFKVLEGRELSRDDWSGL